MENYRQITDEQIFKALKVTRNLESKQNKQLLVSSQDIRLSFSFFKIPNTSSKNCKLLKVVLPHIIQNDDVCLLVGDGVEGRKDRTKIEDTIHFYEEKFAKFGITEISEVIPLLKLKLEYQTFESRRALATRFDSFLADDKIFRLLPSFLGKSFLGQKKYPLQVRLGEKCMERELKKALHTTVCPISLKGNSHSMAIGHLGMKDEEMVQNIRSAMLKIAEEGPGGSSNLQSFHLSFQSLPSLPLFVSSADRQTVEIPKLPKPVTYRPKPKMEEVSTVKGRVMVAEDGTITIIKGDGKIKQIIGGKEPFKKKLKRAKNASEDAKKGEPAAKKAKVQTKKDEVSSVTPVTPQNKKVKQKSTPGKPPSSRKTISPRPAAQESEMDAHVATDKSKQSVKTPRLATPKPGKPVTKSPKPGKPVTKSPVVTTTAPPAGSPKLVTKAVATPIRSKATPKPSKVNTPKAPKTPASMMITTEPALTTITSESVTQGIETPKPVKTPKLAKKVIQTPKQALVTPKPVKLVPNTPKSNEKSAITPKLTKKDFATPKSVKKQKLVQQVVVTPKPSDASPKPDIALKDVANAVSVDMVQTPTLKKRKSVSTAKGPASAKSIRKVKTPMQSSATPKQSPKLSEDFKSAKENTESKKSPKKKPSTPMITPPGSRRVLRSKVKMPTPKSAKKMN